MLDCTTPRAPGMRRGRMRSGGGAVRRWPTSRYTARGSDISLALGEAPKITSTFSFLGSGGATQKRQIARSIQDERRPRASERVAKATRLRPAWGANHRGWVSAF